MSQPFPFSGRGDRAYSGLTSSDGASASPVLPSASFDSRRGFQPRLWIRLLTIPWQPRQLGVHQFAQENEQVLFGKITLQWE